MAQVEIECHQQFCWHLSEEVILELQRLRAGEDRTFLGEVLNTLEGAGHGSCENCQGQLVEDVFTVQIGEGDTIVTFSWGVDGAA
jgi:hypothetical protein